VRNCLALLLATQAAAALLVLGVSQILGDSQLFFAKLIFTFKDQFGLLNVVKAGALFVLMILPTLCFGASFPLVSKIYTRSMAHVGHSIGFAYMVNTIGALLGPFVAGFVLIPLLGKEAGLKVAAGLQLSTSVVIAALMFSRRPRDLRRQMWMAAAAAAGLTLCLVFPSWSHRQLSIGKYHDLEEIRPVLTRSGWLEALFQGTRELEKVERGVRGRHRRVYQCGEVHGCAGQHQPGHGQQRENGRVIPPGHGNADPAGSFFDAVPQEPSVGDGYRPGQRHHRG
jgi:spermidine synthase